MLTKNNLRTKWQSSVQVKESVLENFHLKWFRSVHVKHDKAYLIMLELTHYGRLLVLETRKLIKSILCFRKTKSISLPYPSAKVMLDHTLHEYSPWSHGQDPIKKHRGGGSIWTAGVTSFTIISGGVRMAVIASGFSDAHRQACFSPVCECSQTRLIWSVCLFFCFCWRCTNH